MGKNRHRTYIYGNAIHFKRHSKPVEKTIVAEGFKIHVYSDIVEGVVRYSSVVQRLRKINGRLDKRVDRAGYLQPSADDAVTFAMNRAKVLMDKPQPPKKEPKLPKLPSQPYLRTGRKYELNEVLDHVIFESQRNRETQNRDYDGDPINMASLRYQCFASKGTRCVKCGLEGSFFVKEKANSKEQAKRYHFNLYGIKDGNEVLFTKDHIIPVSKKGRNHLSNLQTMCSPCNNEKGDTLVLPDKLIKQREPSDCAICSLAMYFHTSYEEVLKLSGRPVGDFEHRGTSYRELQKIAAKLGQEIVSCSEYVYGIPALFSVPNEDDSGFHMVYDGKNVYDPSNDAPFKWTEESVTKQCRRTFRKRGESYLTLWDRISIRIWKLYQTFPQKSEHPSGKMSLVK